MKSAASAKYPTLTTEEIKNLPIISEIRADGCVLFLWATVPMLEDALDVMPAWGFEYKNRTGTPRDTTRFVCSRRFVLAGRARQSFATMGR